MQATRNFHIELQIVFCFCVRSLNFGNSTNCFKALSNIVFVFQFKTNRPIFNEVWLEVFKLQSLFFGCLYYGHSIGLIGNFTPTQTEARFTNNFRLRRILEHVVVKKFHRNASKISLFITVKTIKISNSSSRCIGVEIRLYA